MADPDETRPQDGALVLTLYGKTADLVRAEASRRDMSYDRVVREIVWCWYVDLETERRQSFDPRAVSKEGPPHGH